MTDNHPTPPEFEQDLEADKVVSDDIARRADKLKREVAPPKPKLDHPDNGGVI